MIKNNFIISLIVVGSILLMNCNHKKMVENRSDDQKYLIIDSMYILHNNYNNESIDIKRFLKKDKNEFYIKDNMRLYNLITKSNKLYFIQEHYFYVDSIKNRVRYYYAFDLIAKKTSVLSIQKITQNTDINGSEKYCIINLNSACPDTISVNNGILDKNNTDYLPIFLSKFQLFNNIFSLDFNQEKLIHASSIGIATAQGANNIFNILLRSKGVDHAYNNPVLSNDGKYFSCVEYSNLYESKPNSFFVVYDLINKKIIHRKKNDGLIEARLSPDNKKLLLVCQDDLLNNFFSKKEVTKKNFKIYLYDLENNKLKFISYGINACWIS